MDLDLLGVFWKEKTHSIAAFLKTDQARYLGLF